MPLEKYTESYLKEQLPAEIREHLRADGHDATRLPSYEYLRAKGFQTRGLNQALKRHFGDELTLGQFLTEQGFGHERNGEWPCSHEETLKVLTEFEYARVKRNGDRPPTRETMKSALRWVLRRSTKLHGTDNLLEYARADTTVEERRQNKRVEKIIDELHDELSGGAAKNYSRYWKDFYTFSAIRKRVDYNPVEEVMSQFSFDTGTDSEPERLSENQIQILWKTLEHLPDRQNRSPAVENLATRHGLRTWRLKMMTLLVFMIGVGPRAKDVVRTEPRDDWHLDEDEPYVQFPVRKNLPSEVPVLAYPNFLSAYQNFLEKTQSDWNGKMFPSELAESGSKSSNTLNSWLAALCEEAGVTLDNGSSPTLQNLRQTWQNEYHAVLRKNEVQLKIVAKEAGTRDYKQVHQSYRTTEEERRTIRALASKDFESLLPIKELPEVMTEVLNDRDYIDHQSSLTDFDLQRQSNS